MSSLLLNFFYCPILPRDEWSATWPRSGYLSTPALHISVPKRKKAFSPQNFEQILFLQLLLLSRHLHQTDPRFRTYLMTNHQRLWRISCIFGQEISRIGTWKFSLDPRRFLTIVRSSRGNAFSHNLHTASHRSVSIKYCSTSSLSLLSRSWNPAYLAQIHLNLAGFPSSKALACNKGIWEI